MGYGGVVVRPFGLIALARRIYGTQNLPGHPLHQGYYFVYNLDIKYEWPLANIFIWKNSTTSFENA
jgi:hypothetical protein